MEGKAMVNQKLKEKLQIPGDIIGPEPAKRMETL